ncbi:beta-N-acetylglucosaminidase domain-containing protein [Streptomyces orinoci]|uniref:Beta-N-acetylglucosaminidase domain-containing protein n=1 Tax=Streptomyces orinoci TaxID=67339 RepID=A0ABV3JQL6_STRON|nr:beta-N-acetylglucosaminidase domain-containing protein [Streptomyces orinoci]
MGNDLSSDSRADGRRPRRSLGIGSLTPRPRRAGVTVLAAALLGGLLAGTPEAMAAPRPEDPAATAPDGGEQDGTGGLPPVWPRPQSGRAQGAYAPVGTEVTLMSGPDTDHQAIGALRDLLHDLGARTVVDAQPGGTPPPRGLIVYAGGRPAEDALHALGAPPVGDLPQGGYRLATGVRDGRPTVALSGEGEDGLFHAVQTLRQLAQERDGGHAFAGAVIRDWPGTAVRGLTEGFYGQPWSWSQRLSQLDFMGRNKLNRYLYAPGDDPYRQARWRDPYPADQRDAFRELAERARRNHVTLGWAVSPGQAMCFSSAADLRALKRKVDAMWALGVRAFQLQFPNVSYTEWHCGADRDKFGRGPEAAAKAQAKVANALAGHLAAKGGAAPPLSLLPTEFFQDGRTTFRRALAEHLDSRVEVAWTGVGVVPKTITGGELAAAQSAFGHHRLVTMDNYPVNDFTQNRIFLGPYTGRDPAVAVGSSALLANASAQPTAARIPLFTTADYAWNPRGYRPQESWQAAMDALAGGDGKAGDALRALAGNDASSVLGGDESAYLRPLLDDFWSALSGTDSDRLTAAAGKLRAAFRVMAGAPRALGNTLGTEVGPWLDQLGRYGEAGGQAVEMLTATARGDGAAVWRAELELLRLRERIGREEAVVGDGVLAPFLTQALARANGWLGVDRPLGTAGRATDGDPASTVTAKPGDTLDVPLRRAMPLTAVTVLTDPASGVRGQVQARTDRGWQPLGAVADSGWTHLAAHGVRADALRVVWDSGATPPALHEITPWAADGSTAGLRLTSSEITADAGGDAAVAELKVVNQRPQTITESLAVKAPKDVPVSAPSQVTVVRGGVTTVRIELKVPAGNTARTFTVPIQLAGQERTLTVHAYPPAGGPDLAQGGRADASSTEAADYPASAAVDGDLATRWSSRPDDHAWWQVQLPRTVRLGSVVLHWQEAYAARYRVQVSADGRIWRDAATVTDGKGGVETLRMDAPGTRYLRVQGEKRATPFGYSLWEVEAYATQDAGGH